MDKAEYEKKLAALEDRKIETFEISKKHPEQLSLKKISEEYGITVDYDQDEEFDEFIGLNGQHIQVI